MINKMASNNILSFVLTILSTIIAILSMGFAVYVYKKDKMKKRELDKIAKIVGENIDLTDKTDKIKELSMQLDELNKIINEEIPIRAKKVALQDRLDRSLMELADCYNDVSEIYKELQFYEENNKDEKLSNEIFDKISKEIEPKYLLNEKLSRYTIILFISSFQTNIISHIHVFYKVWEIVCTAFWVIEGIYVYKIIKAYYDLRNSEILKFLTLILLFFAAIFLFAIEIIIILLFDNFDRNMTLYLVYSFLGEIVSLYALHKVENRNSMK